MSTSRSLLYIAAGIVGLTVLAVAVVLLAGGNGGQSFEPGTPQAAMQDYLEAWDGEDYDSAYEHLSAAVRENLTLEEYRRAARDYYAYSYPGAPRRAVYIDRVDGSGDRVRLVMTVEEYYGDGIGGGSYRSERLIRMVRESGAWKIDEPLMWLDPNPVPF